MQTNIQEKPKLTMQQLGALADAFRKDIMTIKRWEKKNDDRLTSDKAKETLSKITQ